MYDHLSTNAQALREGDPLTREQITALAQLENNWIEGRGRVDGDRVENVLHAFMCHSLGECVCSTQKEIV